MRLDGLLGDWSSHRDGYVVRRPRGWRQLKDLLSLVAFGSLGLVMQHFFDGLQPFGYFMFAMTTGSGVWGIIRPGVQLSVDERGVRLGEAQVPWTSVWQVVLVRDAPAPGKVEPGPAQVGVRLIRSAPLPKGIAGVIYDPRDPSAIPDQLRSRVTDGRVDAVGVQAAVARWAPQHVVLAERVGDREHVLAGPS
ncbi:MAG: hypothetical protein GEV07_23195 [Streptosporangiales bacterium]|nr:hypothetical protein [Streptosporangiales bacterium]